MGKITEMRTTMDGGFELTAEFEAGETFWDPKWRFESNETYLKKIESDLNKNGWMPSLYNPDVYEITLGDIYDKLGIPCFNRRAHVWTCSKYGIRKIYYNDKKKTTVVVWETGEKTKVKMAEGDHCYIMNAVSAAVMKRKYGSNSAFKAHVEKVLGGYNDSAYQVLARAESSEIYGGYEELFMLIADKLILQ